MEIYYMQDKLYIDINDNINFTLINKLKRKLFHILDIYNINNIEIVINSNSNYDSTLIDDLIKEYDNKYNGILIVK